MPSVLIAAPDAKEARSLLRQFSAEGVASHEVAAGSLSCFALPSLDMLLAVGGNGKAQFAAQTRYLLDRFPDVKLLVCAGAAGRLSSSLEIGDVVVGAGTVEHDYKARISPKPLPRHHPDPATLQQFRRAVATTAFPFGVHFGTIASGDEDVVDAVRASELRAATEALCVAWEGSGGARAARLSGVAFLEIRCITDAAEGDVSAAFQENVHRVMANAAKLLLAWQRSERSAV